MRKFWTLLALAAALAAAGTFLFKRGHQRWTSDSAAALAEFERGLDAEMKLYHEDAEQHYRRALELDPGFAMATLKVLRYTRGSEEAERARLAASLRVALANQDLCPRERVLIEHRLAALDKDEARAARLVEEYLAKVPRDPFALAIRCDGLWGSEDWAAAEACGRRLLEIDPNWVLAQNHLGYLAMAQGRFPEAESHFRTYLYIAPDQANPHDSLAELLILRGRYEEAERELDEALRVKPDFCISYEHLLDGAILRRDPAALDPAIARLERVEGCEEDFVAAQRLRAAIWSAIEAGDLGGAWQLAASAEQKYTKRPDVLAARVALLAGYPEAAQRAEAALVEALEEARSDRTKRELEALRAHLEGLLAAARGDFERAVAGFRAADQKLAYWGGGQGLFKLFNRMDFAGALERTGEAGAADALRKEIEAVNPDVMDRFATSPLGRLTVQLSDR